MSDKQKPQLLTVQRVLSDGIYSIPVYQRNYAWGVREIGQLIADVRDYAQRNAQSQAHDYYIGTLVVYERYTEQKAYWEVVDGQQRLTTLSLLVSVLRALHPELAASMQRMPLQFESRAASSHALQAVFSQPLHAAALAWEDATKDSPDDASGASSIWQGRAIIESLLREIPGAERKAFATFLLEQVRLLRVELPPRTDLNHYFEVMNNRGGQLAKHEVLKARLLGTLQRQGQQAAMKVLHAVWDASAVMDRSVQSGFVPAMRKSLFAADGRLLLVKTPQELLRRFEGSDDKAVVPKSLSQLIAAGSSAACVRHQTDKLLAAEEEDDESKAQFGAVINFPNFLLQVLAMMPGDALANTPLDDKHLLTAFEPLLRGDAEQIQEFAYRLLRCRFLLDQHVIKSSVESQSDDEHWQLQRCKFRNDKAVLQWVNAFEVTEQDYGERLRMLQAALHVSYMLPTRKHWLQGVLRWLFRQDVTQAIEAQAFLLALEELTKAFVLEEGSSATYEEIVRREDGFFVSPQPDSGLMKTLPKKLVYGQARLIDFNFLDYLLWLQANGKNETNATEWREFEFTSTRRSVEHLHPQTELFSGNAWADEHLHAFGNLCLVSHAMNSRLSNSGPEDKFKQLMSEKKSQSLKALAMHSVFADQGQWSADSAMCQHAKQMLVLLQNALVSDGLTVCMPS
ncbi:GmrSD restriction endonuclease domain-containing protein [Comamonas testosteroni]|uniref:GmrSD restriction endonuclease domain-containing protein n=1 Tax=Comamonas testosteroni TaxID=285 RepID=UPI00191508F2|nr:DUF262 domain-containing protein [Comamonas testosteroni]QQN68412.1 DUF262 domain-containing protein [Comamonas testosteroni]